MAQQPSIPKGTRDFTPSEMMKRNYIFDTIRSVYKNYGFLPIETPAMETMQTLMGKYGEEGDRLIFKILNSGDFKTSVEPNDYANATSLALANKFCEKALRYDLTVPFARFVVMHRNEIQLPFKRYQLQPVWRADRPQKGRYREFYQCDADIVGSDSLLNEVELVQIIDTVFNKFGINITVKLNNRKILTGIAEIIGEPEKIVDITVAIDKLDKIGIENVNAELLEKGLTEEKIKALQPIIMLQGTTEEKFAKLKQILAASETGMKGVAEMEYIFGMLKNVNIKATLQLDLTLARGLNYYTGAILEVKANDVEMGSICGGGRYDNLTGIFGMPGLSGVGISFGADRIYDVLNQLDAYPKDTKEATKLLFVNFGDTEVAYILPIIAGLRASGFACELYPDAAKMKKQMQYANERNIPYVAIVGSDEIAQNKVMVKNMATGEQSLVDKDAVKTVVL